MTLYARYLGTRDGEAVPGHLPLTVDTVGKDVTTIGTPERLRDFAGKLAKHTGLADIEVYAVTTAELVDTETAEDES